VHRAGAGDVPGARLRAAHAAGSVPRPGAAGGARGGRHRALRAGRVPARAAGQRVRPGGAFGDVPVHARMARGGAVRAGRGRARDGVGVGRGEPPTTGAARGDDLLRMLPRLLLGTAAALLLSAPAASASSVAYTEGGNIVLSSADGAK